MESCLICFVLNVYPHYDDHNGNIRQPSSTMNDHDEESDNGSLLKSPFDAEQEQDLVDEQGNLLVRSIFDCDMFKTGHLMDGKTFWKCEWCKRQFSPRNATKAMDHVLKVRGNIKSCAGVIPKGYQMKYHGFRNNSNQQTSNKKRMRHCFDEKQKENTSALSQSLFLKKNRKELVTKKQNVVADNVSLTTDSTLKTKHSGDSDGCLPVAGPPITYQTTLTDPKKGKHNYLTATIVDFIHCSSLPFSAVEDPKFQKMIQAAMGCSTESFKFPNRKDVGGIHLEKNYNEYYERQTEKLLNEADKYGLFVHGDGATIHRSPLFNIMASGACCPAAILKIVDCHKHMSSGGTKTGVYIAGLVKEQMDLLDPEKNLIDVVSFDGASNVQKAAQILQADCPRLFVIPAVEHSVSLFFSDLAKIEEVCSILYFIFKILYCH